MNPITGLPIQEENKTLSKEQHYIPDQRKGSFFSLFGSAPDFEEKQRLQAEIEEGQHMIKSGEEKLFQDLNHIYNWDDSDNIPRNVEAMMEFINTKTNKRILAQVDALFAYYYTHILGGRENPLLTRETDDRTKDLIRISFLLNLIKGESFSEHDKYMGYDIKLEDINELIISIKTRSQEQQKHDENLRKEISRRQLQTQDLERNRELLRGEIEYAKNAGAPTATINSLKRRFDVVEGEVAESQRRVSSLNKGDFVRGRGGKKKRRSTCKKNRRKRKRNKTRHRLRR
jgi:hypothetical protein